MAEVLENIGRGTRITLTAITALATYVDVQNSIGFDEVMNRELGPIANLVGDVPLGLPIFALGVLISALMQSRGVSERTANVVGAITIGTLFAVAVWAELNVQTLGAQQFTPDRWDLIGLTLGVAGARASMEVFAPKLHRYFF